MKKLILFLVAFLALGSASHAQTATPAATTPTAATPAATGAAAPAKPATAQQNRMSACAKQYHEKNLPKAQYKSFMSQCLTTHPAATTPAASAMPATAKP